MLNLSGHAFSLLLVLFVNDLKVSLGAFLKTLSVSKSISHSFVVLYQSPLHCANTVKISQVLLFICHDTTLEFGKVIGNCVDLVECILTEGIYIVLLNFFINLMQLHIFLSSKLLSL